METVKVQVVFDEEWFPVHAVKFPGEQFYGEQYSGYIFDVPAERAEVWQQVFRDFEMVQAEIAEYMPSADNA